MAGAPTTAADPCALASPAVVISSTASQGAIGGADVAAFLPMAPPGQPPTGGPPSTGSAVPGATVPSTGGSPSTGGAAPVARVPRRVTAQALSGGKGVPIKVEVTAAGQVKLSGTVTVGLRLTPAVRKKPKRLKGARMTLRVSQGSLSATKLVTLR